MGRWELAGGSDWRGGRNPDEVGVSGAAHGPLAAGRGGTWTGALSRARGEAVLEAVFKEELTGFLGGGVCKAGVGDVQEEAGQPSQVLSSL